MFSKRHFLLMLLVALTASCSYFFDEKKNKSNVYNLSLSEKANVGCLKKNSQLLRDYFALRGDNDQMAQELRAMNTCVNDAIRLFVKHTRGGNADYYEPQEIHDFFLTVFDHYSYPAGLLVEAAALKDSLLGGGATIISKEEVRVLPEYVNFFYRGLADLAKYRHLLFSKRKNDRWEDFAPAGNALLAVVAGFKKLPRKQSGEFDYESMVRLAKYFLDENDDNWFKSFDLINSIQSLLVKGQRGLVDIRQLNGLLDNLAPLYLSYIEFNKFLKEDATECNGDQDCIDKKYYRDFSTVFTFPGLVTRLIKNPNVFLGNNINILTSIQSRILKVLKHSLEETGGVSISYVNEIIATLTRIEALPDFIKADTLNYMAPQFFGFWLSKAPCAGQCTEVVVRADQIDTLIEVVDGWKERQLWINTFAGGGARFLGKKQLRSNMKKSKLFSRNLLDFQEATEQVTHTHWTDYVHIGVKELNYKDLVIFNKLFTLIKLFLSPFNDNSKQTDVVEYYLTQGQTQYFYEWFRPLALELKLIDPRSRSSGKQAFIEINLFGSQASKPERLDFTELIEYFEIALSTGQRSVYLMENKFVPCEIPNTIDVFNFVRREAHCFRSEFDNKANEYFFSTMPKMMQYFSNDKSADYATLLKVLEKSGRQGILADEPFDTDAVRVMSSIIQYSESLFLRFNTDDSDEVLTTEELKQVLKHIVPNLRLLIKDSLDPVTVKTLYKFFPNFEENLVSYILKNNEIPGILTAETSLTTGSGLAQLKIFKEWSELAPSWLQKDARARRENIMMVISGLSAFARATKIKNIKKIFVDNELIFEKGITDPDSPIFASLAAELSCSTLKDREVRDWLFKNQEKYWKETLEYFDVKVGKFSVFGYEFGGNSVKLHSNDLPQTGLFAGWEGAVTVKLIEHFNNDPLSQYCGLPFVPGVHKIIDDSKATDNSGADNGNISP